MDKMSKLNELKTRYVKAQYEPDANCIKCEGAGEFDFKGEFLSGMKPCYCIFFGHDFIDIYKDSMISTISKIKQEENKYFAEQGWIEVEKGAWASAELNLCSSCKHSNSSHFTRDFVEFTCLENGCECKTN